MNKSQIEATSELVAKIDAKVQRKLQKHAKKHGLNDEESAKLAKAWKRAAKAMRRH